MGGPEAVDPARAAEAAGPTTSFEFRGTKFTIPTAFDDWSLDLVESIEEGKNAGICRGALGPEQWEQVRAMRLKMRDVADLANQISKALGFGSTGE